MLELFTEEILGLPHIISPMIQGMLPSSPKLGDLKSLYDRVCEFHPEERLYRLFGPSLSYETLLQLCLTVVEQHPEYRFVQPQIYVDSLARATAARIMFDADVGNQWTLSFEMFKRTGYSLLTVLFDIQNAADISSSDSPFGYEQFYVLYCLYSKYAPANDVQRPLQEIQLRSFNEFQFNGKFVRRVFKGCGRRTLVPNQFNYEDFIILMLSDVCYDTPQACRFMFNVADIE